MKGFHLTISSADKIHYQGEVLLCTVTTFKGQLGIKKNHESFMALLNGNSPISYRTIKNEEQKIVIKDGILDFRKNYCTIAISTP